MRVIAILALMLTPATASAQDKTKKGTSDPNKIICRTQEVIGSRLQSTRTCLTRLQWAQRDDEGRKTVNRIQDNKSYQDRR